MDPAVSLSSSLSPPTRMPVSPAAPGALEENTVQFIVVFLHPVLGVALSRCSVKTGWWRDGWMDAGGEMGGWMKEGVSKRTQRGGQVSQQEAMTKGKGRDTEWTGPTSPGREGHTSKRSRK